MNKPLVLAGIAFLFSPLTFAKTETLVLMGVNDFHGSLLSQHFKTRTKTGKRVIAYDRGGADVLAAHIRILRKEFGSRFFIIDAGDDFGGAIESDLKQGAPMIQFWNSVGLTATAVGNHEFDFGEDVLKKRIAEAHYPFLSANLDGLSGTSPSLLVSIAGLKVGIIGLTTRETPDATQKENTKGLTFSEFGPATVREAKKLRERGAAIVVVAAHAGGQELAAFLESLPKETIDAVVSGHTHVLMKERISGVPVVQAGAHGLFYNLIYLTYDLDHHRLSETPVRMEGPIPVCPRVFANQGDCDGEKPAPPKGRGPLVAAMLHGQPVRVDPKDQESLSAWIGNDLKKNQSVVGTAARNVERKVSTGSAESPLGNLVADILKDRLNADFSLINPNGIRADLEEGSITYGDVFRALPFENKMVRLKVSGKEMKEIIAAAESGVREFFAIAGLRVQLKKEEGQEEYTVESATLNNGDPLNDDQFYWLATVDFLAKGGDGMGSTLAKLPLDRWQDEGWGLIRDGVAKSLGAMSPLNSADHPLLNPKMPRIKFVR